MNRMILVLMSALSVNAHDPLKPEMITLENAVVQHETGDSGNEADSDDNLAAIVFRPFEAHLYSSSFNFFYGDFTLGYSFGVGKFGNLLSGELLNLTMFRGFIDSEHARISLEYSLNTSDFRGDFIEGLFTLKNSFGINASFPFYAVEPGIYAYVNARHFFFSGNDDISLKAGARICYSFLGHYNISAFYQHEWNMELSPSDIDRVGLNFTFSF